MGGLRLRRSKIMEERFFEDGGVLRRWGFFEGGREVLRRWRVLRRWEEGSSKMEGCSIFWPRITKNISHRRSSEPEDRRTRLSSSFGVPPSFGLRPRRSIYPPSSIFGPADQTTPPYSTFRAKIGSKIAIGPVVPAPTRPWYFHVFRFDRFIFFVAYQ